jgi:hypothetical protein
MANKDTIRVQVTENRMGHLTIAPVNKKLLKEYGDIYLQGEQDVLSFLEYIGKNYYDGIRFNMDLWYFEEMVGVW